MERNDLGVATWVKLDRRQAAAITEAILSLIDMAGGPYREVATKTLVRALMGDVVPDLKIKKRDMARVAKAIEKAETTLEGFSPNPDDDLIVVSDGLSGHAAWAVTRLTAAARVMFRDHTKERLETVTLRKITKYPPALLMAPRYYGPAVVASAVVLARRAGLSWDVQMGSTNPDSGEVLVFLRNWLTLPTPKGE